MRIYIYIWLLFCGIPVYDQVLLQKSTYVFKVSGQMHRRIHQTKLARTSRTKRLLSMKLRTGYVLVTFSGEIMMLYILLLSTELQ